MNPIHEREVIEESNAPWSSALIAKKGTNELRWCDDFRSLNQVTFKDNYPLPNIPSMLYKLAWLNIFSTWVSQEAYHSIKLSPESCM